MYNGNICYNSFCIHVILNVIIHVRSVDHSHLYHMMRYISTGIIASVLYGCSDDTPSTHALVDEDESSDSGRIVVPARVHELTKDDTEMHDINEESINSLLDELHHLGREHAKKACTECKRAPTSTSLRSTLVRSILEINKVDNPLANRFMQVGKGIASGRITGSDDLNRPLYTMNLCLEIIMGMGTHEMDQAQRESLIHQLETLLKSASAERSASQHEVYDKLENQDLAASLVGSKSSLLLIAELLDMDLDPMTRECLSGATQKLLTPSDSINDNSLQITLTLRRIKAQLILGKAHVNPETNARFASKNLLDKLRSLVGIDPSSPDEENQPDPALALGNGEFDDVNIGDDYSASGEQVDGADGGDVDDYSAPGRIDDADRDGSGHSALGARGEDVDDYSAPGRIDGAGRGGNGHSAPGARGEDVDDYSALGVDVGPGRDGNGHSGPGDKVDRARREDVDDDELSGSEVDGAVDGDGEGDDGEADDEDSTTPDDGGDSDDADGDDEEDGDLDGSGTHDGGDDDSEDEEPSTGDGEEESGEGDGDEESGKGGRRGSQPGVPVVRTE